MAEPKPTQIPEWNTGGLNRTDPPPGNKVSGWALNEEPPSSWFNWLQHYTGAWFVWLDERLLEGTGEHDLVINALTPNAAGDGGDVTINAGGPNGAGAGGVVEIYGADGTNQGGNVNLFSGSSTGTGNAGNVTMTGGDSVGNNGGDIFVNAGGGDTQGGLVQIRGGNPVGTDIRGGNVRLRSGDGRGTQGAAVIVYVSEGGTTGSTANPAFSTPYIECDGTANKDVRANRRLLVTDAADTTRGVLQLTPKAQPTAPSAGDIYPDSTTGQLAVHNGARHYNLNTIVKNITDEAVRGQTPNSVASTTIVLNDWPYPAGPTSANPMRYIIPANSLRDGSIIRVRAQFFLDDLGGSTPVPSPGVFVGSIGTESPAGEWRAPTGLDILPVTRAANVYGEARCEVELRVRTLGSPGACDYTWFGAYESSGGARPVEVGTVLLTPPVDTTVALDVFPVCKFDTDVSYQLICNQFLVEVI